MANIKQLDQHVANLIAAGEVIERAASVVKELVENSIDAHSRNISIHLIDSGINEIRVIDDGDGMDLMDAKMCVLPHATSKIKNENDLFTIKTLGFRGEALPSIVAVSNFRLITSTDGQGAIMYSLKGGVPMTEARVAHDKGTEIVVKNLFFNTPARLQNLQSPNVELSHISDYVTKVALSHPDISFTLTNNEKVILKTTGNGDLLEVIASVIGNDCAKNMFKVFDTNGTYRVEGYISNISLTRASKNYMYLFINERVFRSYNISNAILKGYDTLLMNGKYPIVVLNIQADPNLVDVNVHPTKAEVRFYDEENLLRLITEMVAVNLNKQNLAVKMSFTKDENMDPLEKFHQEALSNKNKTTFDSFDEEVVDESLDEEELFVNEIVINEPLNNDEDLPEDFEDEYDESYEDEVEDYEDEVEDYEDEIEEYEEYDESSYDNIEEENNDNYLNENDLFSYNPDNDEQREEFVNDINEEKLASFTAENKTIEEPVVKEQYTQQQYDLFDNQIVDEDAKSDKIGNLYYIGQLFGTYLLAQTDNELVLIDQHAAAERINYEKILKALENNDNIGYDLLVPFNLEFSPSDCLLINESMGIINNLGIGLEEFGNNSYVVRTIPIWIFRGKEQEFVEEIITQIISGKKTTKVEFLNSLAKSLACKKSIKANEYHSAIEIEYLLEDLKNTSNPFTCPHGRPIIIKFDKYEIEKWFKRVV